MVRSVVDVVGMVVFEAIAQVVGLLCAEHESGAQTEGRGTDARDLDAALSEPLLQGVRHHRGIRLEAEEGTIATHVANKAVAVALHIAEFNFKEGANVLNLLKVVTVLDLFPGSAEVKQFHDIDILVKVGALGVQSVFSGGVEATHAGLASEGHHVGAAAVRLVEVPVIVGPHLARLPKAGPCLINNEGDAFPRAQRSKLLVKSRRSHFVFERSNRLNDHCSNVSVRSTLSGDHVLKDLQAASLLSLVCLIVTSKRVDKLGQGSRRPIIGRHVGVVDAGV